MDCSHFNICIVVSHCFNLHFPDDKCCRASLHMFICHLCIFLGGGCSYRLPISSLGCFLIFEFLRFFFVYFGCKFFIRYMVCKHFSPYGLQFLSQSRASNFNKLPVEGFPFSPHLKALSLTLMLNTCSHLPTSQKKSQQRCVLGSTCSETLNQVLISFLPPLRSWAWSTEVIAFIASVRHVLG